MINSPLKIASHGGNVHLDDYLAVGLLYYHLRENGYNNIVVIREDLKDDELINVDYVIDMGLKYDGVKYFDHHHDKDIECSLFLVAKHIDERFYSVMKNAPEFRFLDIKDRFGLKKAMNRHEKMYQAYSKMLEHLLIDNKIINDKESPYYHVGAALYHYMMRKMGMKKQIKTYKNNIKCIHRNGLKVCYIDDVVDMPFLVFKLFDCDILICRSSRNKNLVKIIKNENKENTNSFELSTLSTDFDIAFIHTTGFTASIRYHNLVEETICNKIVDVLSKDFQYLKTNSYLMSFNLH